MTACTKKELTTAAQTVRLWAHETCRVFGDRLINNDDRMWMLNAVKECTRAPFGSSFDTVFSHLDNDKNGKVETLDEFRGLAWSDIMAKFGLPDRPYEEVIDKVAQLEADFESSVQKQQDLEFKSEQCKSRLARAETLISNLGGEQERK